MDWSLVKCGYSRDNSPRCQSVIHSRYGLSISLSIKPKSSLSGKLFHGIITLIFNTENLNE